MPIGTDTDADNVSRRPRRVTARRLPAIRSTSLAFIAWPQCVHRRPTWLIWPHAPKARNLRRDPRVALSGQPYPREEERVVAVIEPERRAVGVG